MAIVVEMSLPGDAFGLGTVFEEHPDARVDLERVVPASEAFLPYFWLSDGGDPGPAATTIREHPSTASLTRLAATDERALFAVEWAEPTGHLLTAFGAGHDGCLWVTGTSDGWHLEVRFEHHERLTAFTTALTTEEVRVTLHRIEEYAPDGAPPVLSEAQEEALALAHARGYFGVPRESTVEDLADEVGISPSAFSERLRRGIDSLAGAADLSVDPRVP